MKRLTTLLVAAIPLLAGCDAWFDRRIDITASDAASFSVAGTPSSSLTRVVRQYAGAHGLTCSASNELPIECYTQPIRVWAAAVAAPNNRFA